MIAMAMVEEIGPHKSEINFEWSDARKELLIKLLAEGLSYAEVADKIGGGCSRLMVRGKARRMKLQRPVRQRESVIPEPSLPPPPEPEPEPPSEYSCTITGLTDRTCRYPLWDFQSKATERFYCGRAADLLAGRPYCDAHMERCLGQRVPISPRARR